MVVDIGIHVYTECPCTFTMWKLLVSQPYKAHSKESTPKSSELSVFRCQLCKYKELSTKRDYFLHISTHLKHHETVPCAFVGCTFETNVYGIYHSHKNRKHSSYILKDFKDEVVTFHNLPELLSSYAAEEVSTEEFEN